ncbi:alpha/beta hydrolase [Shouchella shacheensis]|uniref:alpha/beta hydrolase n=1 Tax=Shouchella shacheensis TaxID=1649580 RepID=UPI00073FAC30|nr:alpha/beta hydrolase [Shouchella shacheensis]
MSDHKHLFVKGEDETKPTFVLLHGTGGNEKDLLPIVNMIDEGASVLGIRGNISENGMPRFFKRLAEGVFDKEDLKLRTDELHAFLEEAATEHGIDRQNLVAIGYSNGANIAANLYYEHGAVFKGAMLFHAMVPQQKEALPNLENANVFIGAGKHDPMIPAPETEQLKRDLESAGAAVKTFWTEGGHELMREEIQAAKEWYEAL